MPSEDELLSRAIAGDKDALDQLLQEATPELRQRLAGKISPRWRSLLSVDDVLQETYVDAFLSIGRFSPRQSGTFMGWLLTIAMRNLRDAIRGLEAEIRGGDWQQVFAGGSVDKLSQLVGLSGSTPSGKAIEKENRQKLHAAIARLGPEDHRVIELRDLKELPMKEVAAALGCNVGAAHMRHARAARRLREFLGSTSRYL